LSVAPFLTEEVKLLVTLLTQNVLLAVTAKSILSEASVAKVTVYFICGSMSSLQSECIFENIFGDFKDVCGLIKDSKLFVCDGNRRV